MEERSKTFSAEELAAEYGSLADLPRGLYAAFLELLDPEQKKLFKPIGAAIRRVKRVEKEKKVLASAASPREQLHDAITEAQGKVSAGDIERLIDAAVDKGDIGALRVLAQLGGIDLTERAKQEVGPGAKVISIRPRPLLELTAEQQAIVREQVGASEG